MGGKAPKVDRSLQEERARQEAEAQAETARLEAAQAEDERQRRIGLLGRRSLLTGSELGYPSTLGN